MINLLMVGGVVQSEFSASISPSSFFIVSQNGSYTSPYFTANVSGGAGPYEYEWTITGLAKIVGDGEKVKIQAGGYNSEAEGSLSLKVTDTGNGNAELTASSNYSILFGEPR